MKLGVQMSSVTPYLQSVEQLQAACEKVAQMGYEDVQLQGVSVDIPDGEIARALQQAGLRCVATQEDYPAGFGANPERFIARAQACGSRYLTCALLPREVDSPEKLQRFGETFAQIGEKVKQAGMVFAFHPIGRDFQPMEGVPVYERLMDLLPPEIQLTFCVYASFGSGVGYEQVLQKFSGRMDLVHLKDSLRLPSGEEQLMPLGEGSHDWKPVLAACQDAGVQWVFAEQERWNRDAFDCAAASLQYVQSVWPQG